MLCILFAILVLCSAINGQKYRPVVLMHGITSSAADMNEIAGWIRQSFAGIYVVSIEIGNGVDDSFLFPMNKQVDLFCQTVLSDINLRDGFNMLGYSQGSLIVRGAVEKCSLPAYNLITLCGIHQGVFGIPDLQILPEPFRELLSVSEGSRRNRQPIKIIRRKFPHLQKAERRESDHTGSNVYNSAHVQMTIKSKTDLWAGISVSDEMNNLLARLNMAHVDSNEIIQQRLEALSKEAERVFELIDKETSNEQARLLKYVQEIQRRLEELQREWLEAYIVQLDRWRSNELARLHEKLEQHKATMDVMLQRKLALVNQHVDVAKSQIFREEQQRQLKETDIVADVEEISRKNRTQQIRTKACTDIHLKIRANAGNEVISEDSNYNDPDYPYLEHEQ